MNYYDTSSLLILQQDAFKEPFYISYITLKELESIKTSANKDNEIKYKARRLVHLLDENENYEVVFSGKDILEQFNLEQINDNIICGGAYQKNKETPITFYTDDICLKTIAKKIFGLNVKSAKDELKEVDEYKGYKEIIATDEQLACLYQNSNINTYNCLNNQYLIIKNTDNEIIDKLKWNGYKYIPLNFKQINNDFTGKIKPRNIQQELAFDMLQDKNSTIKILTGCYGSGKDFIMISTALDLIKCHKYERIMWVRNNIEVKNSKPIGFLPSGMKDKLMPFAMPMADHLGGRDGLELLISQGKIDIQHFGFIRGRNIENTIILCSEAENMTKEHIQLLIGRVGENSNLWINGDYRQVDEKVFETNNGLISAINNLKGISKFGFVKFEKTERSETAALADLLD